MRSSLLRRWLCRFRTIAAVVPIALLVTLDAFSQPVSPLEQFLRDLNRPPEVLTDEDRFIKEFAKLQEKLRKLSPDDTDRIEKELKKFYDKIERPPPGEEEQLFKEMKKAVDQLFKPPNDEEEKAVKAVKKLLEQGAEPETTVQEWADGLFGWFDRNRDGRLDSDEMTVMLRSSIDRWDGNRDGQIDRSEYRSWFQARVEFHLNSKGGKDSLKLAPARQPEPAEALPERKPAVYRAGRLPPDLPAWFGQLDTDHDGQVGLYEWKHSTWPLDQFRQLDRNDDGFITISEALRWVALCKERAERDPTLARQSASVGFLADGPPVRLENGAKGGAWASKVEKQGKGWADKTKK